MFKVGLRLLAAALMLAGGVGCAARQHATNFIPACPARGVVFVADGAGGSDSTSVAVVDAIAEGGLPFRVERFEWTHGNGRVAADHFDRPHSECEARNLATKITHLVCCNPRPEVYILSHSAGAGVALYAANWLPPDSINRIILLAPSVATDYDLRPALRCAREGVDAFYSRRDRMVLGVATTLFGTTDRQWGTAAAGRVGFQPCPTATDETLLFNRLHQHPWEPAMRASDNRGGHYDSYERRFLHAYVLPLLSQH
jgi:hypothetical protein